MPQALDDANEPINILYYGDGGTGKTSALATMANLGKVVIVNAESGVKARPLKALGVNTKNIHVFPGPDEELTFAGLEKLWADIREQLNKKPGSVAGVIWDSVTEIHKLLMDDIVAENVRAAEARGRERSPFNVERDDYKVMTEQVRQLVRKYRDLDCHFGMSALSRREVDDTDGSVAYVPAITPALQTDLFGWADIVCVTSLADRVGGDGVEYRGLFGPYSKWKGKDRLGGLPLWLVDPTFERVLQYAEGELDVGSDPVMVEARKRAESSAKADAKAKADKE